MNVILDYDVGNLASVKRGFERVGIKSIISKDPNIIQHATSLILPGVGAFNEAMTSLKKSGLIIHILKHINAKKPLLGICLGMQLLYEASEENGYTKGLGLLEGIIKPLKIKKKVPHMGFNKLVFQKPKHPLLKYIQPNDYVYFVHSYYAHSPLNDVVAYADYDINIPAIVAKAPIYATQFHPEKSGHVGLNILKAYGEMIYEHIPRNRSEK